MTAAKVSHLPEPARKPKKSASVTAREAEAEDGYVTIEQCGVELRIPIGDEIPAAVFDAHFERGPLASWNAIKAWVGPEQWQLLRDAGLTRGGVKELDAKLGKLLGN
jgi:hypothetical protein